jgi:Do/DeqQ family serine protease
MKKVFALILISFISGFSGAYVFYKFRLMPEVTKLLTVKNTGQNYQLSDALIKDDSINIGTAINLSGTSAKAVDAGLDFTEASQKSTASVVYVKNTSEQEANTWFDWFFNDRVTQTVISSGSGVIFSADGYIVTNNHVVEDALSLEVIYNKRTYEAKVVGSDPSTDIAVVKIDVNNLPAIKIGSARNLQVGEWVLAVGNPFNLNSTVTAGIVSAKGRQINILKSVFPIESFIQTDAAINPGNSGGALVNSRGELVGINTALLSRTGSYAGYGFAVPVDIVSKVVEDIIKYGEVQKAFFGADVLDIDENVAKKYGIDDFSGVLVQNVQSDGAAYKASLQEGDIILSIDGQPVNSRSDFDEVISYYSPGDNINIKYKRKNNLNTSSVILTNSEGTTAILKREIFSSRTLGADLEVVSKAERDMLGITQGVKITKVRTGLIRNLGIEEGFIITNIGHYPIKDPQSLVDILSKIRGRVIIEGVDKRGTKGYYQYFF